MWTNVLEVRAIEAHWTNMLYWEDLARVSRAIHCLRCGRRRTRVSRVCFKRGEASQALLPSSCHSFKDPISFSIEKFFCAKFLRGEKVPQSRTIHSSKFMALREVPPAFPLIQPILPHTLVWPNLMYEAPSLVIVFDFVIREADP